MHFHKPFPRSALKLTHRCARLAGPHSECARTTQRPQRIDHETLRIMYPRLNMTDRLGYDMIGRLPTSAASTHGALLCVHHNHKRGLTHQSHTNKRSQATCKPGYVSSSPRTIDGAATRDTSHRPSGAYTRVGIRSPTGYGAGPTSLHGCCIRLIHRSHKTEINLKRPCGTHHTQMELLTFINVLKLASSGVAKHNQNSNTSDNNTHTSE